MAQDHFKKHAYQKDRLDWNFNVIFDGQVAAAAMAEAYAAVLQHPGLYTPIPPQWLHATILRVGTTEDYTETEMLAVAEKVQASVADMKLPEFSFDSWWLIGGNVCLHLSPDDQFGRLYEAVAVALESVVGADRTSKPPLGEFIAHTTLAYTKTHDKEQEIHGLLAARHIEPAHFRAMHMPLIKQWPTDGHYEWEIVKDITVGQDKAYE